MQKVYLTTLIRQYERCIQLCNRDDRGGILDHTVTSTWKTELNHARRKKWEANSTFLLRWHGRQSSIAWVKIRWFPSFLPRKVLWKVVCQLAFLQRWNFSYSFFFFFFFLILFLRALHDIEPKYGINCRHGIESGHGSEFMQMLRGVHACCLPFTRHWVEWC